MCYILLSKMKGFVRLQSCPRQWEPWLLPHTSSPRSRQPNEKAHSKATAICFSFYIISHWVVRDTKYCWSNEQASFLSPREILTETRKINAKLNPVQVGAHCIISDWNDSFKVLCFEVVCHMKIGSQYNRCGNRYLKVRCVRYRQRKYIINSFLF